MFFNYEARIKSRGFSSRKQNEGKLPITITKFKIITKFPHFLKGNPVEHLFDYF